jgi:tetratricopeptide (TPR) repeat protein
LPEQIRDLWSSDHAHPSSHALIELFLPVLFFFAAAVFEARQLLLDRDQPRGADYPRKSGRAARVFMAGALAAAGLAAYAVDRSALALAMVASLPFIALAGRAFESRSKLCAVLTIAGSLVVAGHLLSPKGGANASLQVSRALGVDYRDGAKVVWLSMENTDEELIRFVATRTSTKDPVLGLPDATALLLTFSGRTSVLLEGGYRTDLSARRVEMTRLLYGDEEELYLRCRENGVRYLLYSIDYVLDTTRYSPMYLAGLAIVPERFAALSMQFAPEQLDHFNLVYENDRYRLFRVTEAPEPVFLTDHPPVYQRDILERNGDDYQSFRERVGRLMLVYSEARELSSVRRFDAAIGRLNWCLQQAPGFTRARVALGAALLESGQTQRSAEVLMSVIHYAPDNPDALFLAADAYSKLGEKEQALSLLQILYSTTRDTELLDRARLLEALIERGASTPDSSASSPPR